MVGLLNHSPELSRVLCDPSRLLRDRPGWPGSRAWRDTVPGMAKRLSFQDGARPFQGASRSCQDASRSSRPLGFPGHPRQMRASLFLMLVNLAVSCAQAPPTPPMPSPTQLPPDPRASSTAVPDLGTPTRTPGPPITYEAAGVKFQIEDAAVFSNCVTLTFAVRGFHPPTGLPTHAFLPPARTINVRVLAPEGELLGERFGADQGNHGNEGDGRVWLQQHAQYSLPREIPRDQELALEVIAILDEDFQTAQPLSYRFSVVSGPATRSCP